MTKRQVLETVLTFALGILALLFALILNRGYESLGFGLLVAGLSVAILLILGNAALVALLLRSSILDSIKDDLRIVRETINAKPTPWLWPTAEIDTIERRTKASEIWIVSPDLKNDTGAKEIIAIVKRNATRGIKYVYLVPKTEPVETRIRELREIFRKNPEKLMIQKLDHREFSLLSSTHVAIYNPRSENGTQPQVFLELPIEKRGWWVEMFADDAAVFVGKVMRIVDETT